MLFELASHVIVDPLGLFSMFSRVLASILAPKLSMVFRRVLRAGLFPS